MKHNQILRKERLAAARSKGRHTQHEWERLIAILGMSCVRCGSAGRIEKDHIKPIYQGGSDCIRNLQPLCKKCNCAKGPEDIDFRPTNWEKIYFDQGCANG